MEKKKISLKKRLTFTGGLNRHKRLFLENLAILMSSGIDVLSALESIEDDFYSWRMRRFIREIRQEIENGSSLWSAMENSQLFAPRIIGLVRVGEESGRLLQNMNTIMEQQDKEWLLKTKIRTAMLYPAIVLPMTFFVGIGVAWFSLPKLAETFSQLNAELPLVTRILIEIGDFLGKYGYFFIPVTFFSFIVILYFLFSFPKTKAVGQVMISKAPIFKRLIREVELARIGYILSGLLQAGIPIVESLRSLEDSTTFYNYRRFYGFLADRINEGSSFKKSFLAYKKTSSLLPRSIQQMITFGEESGRLAETLEKIGDSYEIKIEASIKNISTLMEPILLIIIGLVVGAIALAVFLPVYDLTTHF